MSDYYENRVRYEVNVSENGWHVLATDSTIRHYKPFQVAAMILTLREKFPEGKITVTTWGGPTDVVVQAAIDGTIDRARLDKQLKKFRDAVNRERSAQDYVGGISEAEAIAPV